MPWPHFSVLGYFGPLTVVGLSLTACSLLHHSDNSWQLWGWVIAIGTATRVIFTAYGIYHFHNQHQEKGSGKVPPRYPLLIPYIETLFSLLWNIRGAIARFTSYNGQAIVSRVPLLPGIDIFLFQDPEALRQVWKASAVLDFRPMAGYFFKNACGMHHEAAKLYTEDPTGFSAQPLNTGHPKQHRVHRMIHESDRKALLGPGLAPTVQRYIDALSARLCAFLSEEWTELEDFWIFIQDTVSSAEIEAIFGPKLFELYPDFTWTFFEFDSMVPSLLQKKAFGRAERARYKIHSQLRMWFKLARRKCAEAGVVDRGNDDAGPYWGSSWSRERHESFAPFFDDDALASHDVGVAWGALGNTIPCAMMAVVHTLQDPLLLERLRREMDGLYSPSSLFRISHEKFQKDSLLLASIYAETLRLHVTVFIPVFPLHGDLKLGRWRIPQGSLGAANAGIMHRNKDIWNTKNGRHPVDSFWGDRFVVDPQDPLSGPVRPGSRYRRSVPHTGEDDRARSTLEGLEGCWIPFGGGKNMCPGRFLAKNVITFALAILTKEFDIELLTERISLGNERFGIGVELPTGPIPFRIRKRKM